MEPLHAPWRISYVRGPKPTGGMGNLFTDIAASSDDIGNYVIAREKLCFAVLNTYPYNGGHLMVVPYRMVPSLAELTDDEMLDLMKLARRCQAALTQVMKPDGFNVGINIGKAAGAGVAEHLHIHVVPRWLGDTNFMPVFANVNILPEALTDVAQHLREALAQ